MRFEVKTTRATGTNCVESLIQDGMCILATTWFDESGSPTPEALILKKVEEILGRELEACEKQQLIQDRILSAGHVKGEVSLIAHELQALEGVISVEYLIDGDILVNFSPGADLRAPQALNIVTHEINLIDQIEAIFESANFVILTYPQTYGGKKGH